jgi:hypothetical protein
MTVRPVFHQPIQASRMSKKSTPNHGEGNPQAASRFNRAEVDFVRSRRGKEAIDAGAKEVLEDDAEIMQAENEGMTPKKR